MRCNTFSGLLLLLTAAVAIIPLAGCGRALNPTTANPQTIPPRVVPAAYQSLYDELALELSDFEAVLDSVEGASGSAPVYAANLTFANGNIGEALLTVQNMQNNILMLDRLRDMGVRGVVLDIKYPLLDPEFPRAGEYLQFFKNIAKECRTRGLKVWADCGAIFAGTAYSSVRVDWSGYTTQSFLDGMGDQLVLISREIKPDYLSLGNEPGTQADLTGLTITPADWTDFIADTLARIDRSSGLLAGAGAGTWEHPSYVEGLIAMPGLDFLDLHIYPPGAHGVYLKRALDWAEQARAAGKRVGVGECWLYKASPKELTGGGVAQAESIFNRDLYSFWAPLDARFTADMMRLARKTGMDFMSFFWTRNFFSYVDYTASLDTLPTNELNRRINQAAYAAIRDGGLSPLGEAYKKEIAGSFSAP